MTLEEKARKIKLLILDVDGIMTDGRIYYGNYGDELKSFDVKDGFGIVLLRKAGIETVIITAKKSKIVRLRAKDIGIRLVYENPSKMKVYEKLLKKFNISGEEVCFAGDDLLDIPILKDAGLAVTVPQAVDEVKQIASYVTKAKAGRGAVREICEIILKSQGKWGEVTAKYIS
ncbi:MAG: HAD-IIIA family hydrolase [Candidatus Omnitrophica bacterium]|nr:HAD-IIIA family hydrolase [Candidatus Omnitrophota bacterium]